MRDIAAALPRTLFALPARIASRPTGISLSPHTRRRLVLAAIVALLLGGLYWFWLRDSALVAVNGVEVAGLMTMPPLASDPEDSRRWFAALAELAAARGLPELSMGTTQDFVVAVEEGATIVRVGTKLYL